MSRTSGSRKYESRSAAVTSGYYVDGNTVRRLDEAPAKKKRKKVSRTAMRNRSRNMQMSRGYVLFLAVVCVAALTACVYFLQLKSELTAQKSAVTAKELEYCQLKADNDAYYSETVASTDLDAIREKALGQLGMQYASTDQIRYYTPGGSSYVRQYQDVPSE